MIGILVNISNLFNIENDENNNRSNGLSTDKTKHMQELKSSDDHILYLFTGHGDQIVANMDKATEKYLYTNDPKEAKKIKSNDLTAYQIFTIPARVNLVFFNSLGQSHEATPCNFENYIITTNSEEVNKKFTQVVTITDMKEGKGAISESDGSDIGDIFYIKYTGGMPCADLYINITDIKMDYGTEYLEQYYLKYQKVGLYKYPLTLDHFYRNECTEGKYIPGLTTEYIYPTEDFFAHTFGKYDKNGKPIINDRTDTGFHEYVIDVIRESGQQINASEGKWLTKEQFIRKIITDYGSKFESNEIDMHLKHMTNEMEQNEYIAKGTLGSVDLSTISTNDKVKLSDLCLYLANIHPNASSITVLVVTCRGDADMDNNSETSTVSERSRSHSHNYDGEAVDL
jgi:hypothetical protein